MLCKWSEGENKADVKSSSQTIKMAAYGASGKEEGDIPKRGKKPLQKKMLPSLVPL